MNTYLASGKPPKLQTNGVAIAIVRVKTNLIEIVFFGSHLLKTLILKPISIPAMKPPRI